MASENARSNSPLFSTNSDDSARKKLRREGAIDHPDELPLVVINGRMEENERLPKLDEGMPVIMSRAGDGGDENSESHPQFNGFPYSANLNSVFGTEVGESIPDVNMYQQKKTLAKGMMDLALFSANVNQLRYVLQSSSSHPYYYPSLVFISISLIFQLAVGVGLTWNATYNVKNEKEICIANKINNFTVIGIFIVTVVNVFISAFCVANVPKT